MKIELNLFLNTIYLRSFTAEGENICKKVMRKNSLLASSHGSDEDRFDNSLNVDHRLASEEAIASIIDNANPAPHHYHTSFHRSRSSSAHSSSDSQTERITVSYRKQSLRSALSVTGRDKTKIFGSNGEEKWYAGGSSSEDASERGDTDFLPHSSPSISEPGVSSHEILAVEPILVGESSPVGESATSSPLERMPYGGVEDPRNFIINMIIDSSTGSVEVQDIFRHLKWEKNYAKTWGAVTEYLQGYHSVFVLSPIDDRVTLCRPVISSLRKREFKRNKSKKRTEEELISAHIGSISCSCVAERIVLEELQSVYRRRGYLTDIKYGVLHVSAKHVFDLFAFENGFIVWWGMNRRHHWMIEDDFFSPKSPASQALRSSFAMSDVRELFPDWSSYEVDDSYFPLKVDEKASERFSKMLCFDHYRIPSVEPDRSDVMLTVSFCLGRSACIDYYEHVTQTLHQQVLSIPHEFSGLMEYFSTQKVVRSLQGELQVTQLALTTLKDTPNFLWEMPWLQVFYALTELQRSSEHRTSWFCARGDALLQSLSSTKNRRHRLFMLGSDVFLIAILIIDVFFMTARLIVKLFFKLEGEE